MFGVGDVFNNEMLIDILGDRSVLDGPFFKEWVEPAGYCDMVGGVVLRQGSRHGTYSLILPRARGPATADDLATVSLVSPHIQRAVAIGDLLGTRATAVRTLDATLDQLSVGVLVVDAGCRVLYANRAAEQTMAAGDDGLKCEHGLLKAIAPAADAALAAAIVQAGADPAGLGEAGLGIPLPSGRSQPRVAHLLPLHGLHGHRTDIARAVAAVFVSQPADCGLPWQEALAGLFGLSPAEARVLAALVNGGGRDDVAQTLGISRQTLKSHLARIYAKTGTTGHAEVRNLVASLSLPLRRPD